MTEYRIGTAEADITPPVGTPLAGNFRDDYASRGVYAPLCCRAAVVRRGDSAVAVAAADLLSVPEELVARVRREVAAGCDLAPERVMLAAIHTHSGPAVEALADEADPAPIRDFLAPRIAEAILSAARRCREGRLWSAARQREGICFNRRLRLTDGRTVMNWTRPDPATIDGPLGPVDPEIGILAAGDAPDRPRFVAANLALHAAVLAGDNWLFSADWPGHYYAAVRDCFGPETAAMFLQGALGNVNHIDAWDGQQGRGQKEAQRIGSLVGLSVCQALHAAEEVSGPIRWSSRRVAVPPRQVSPEQLARARRLVAESAGRPAGTVDGIPDLLFARDQLALAGRTAPVQLEVQVFRIGQVALVALPGEFFVESGLEIKRRSPARTTLVVCLANGSAGYVPTPEAFEEGGYEPTTWRYSRLAPQAGDLCVAAAAEQLVELFEVRDGNE